LNFFVKKSILKTHESPEVQRDILRQALPADETVSSLRSNFPNRPSTTKHTMQLCISLQLTDYMLPQEKQAMKIKTCNIFLCRNNGEQNYQSLTLKNMALIFSFAPYMLHMHGMCSDNSLTMSIHRSVPHGKTLEPIVRLISIKQQST